jgi:hypothetical protein
VTGLEVDRDHASVVLVQAVDVLTALLYLLAPSASVDGMAEYVVADNPPGMRATIHYCNDRCPEQIRCCISTAGECEFSRSCQSPTLRSMPSFLHDGPADRPVLVLAHGAGAPMDSRFMATFACELGTRGIHVIRFEFPYMAARREGRRPGVDREPVLLDTWREVVAALGDAGTLAIGGKSMGGRMASMVADELGVRALVCLGYPFHAPGRADSPRIAHLRTLVTPALIVQGTRDPFGHQHEVEEYGLSPAIRIHWLDDGDHDFKPRASSGRTQEQNWTEAVDVVARFLGEGSPVSRP